MSYRTQFPDFPESTMPSLPAGLEDLSWRNDAMPRFDVEHGGRTLSLWVDYKDVALRETGQGGRFTVMAEDEPGTPEFILETDSLEEALAGLLGEMFTHGLRDVLTVNQWEDMRRRNAADPECAAGLTCHSHDFCDSNVVMAEAFAALYGREIAAPCDVEESSSPAEAQARADSDVVICNAAWAYAAKAHLGAKG